MKNYLIIISFSNQGETILNFFRLKLLNLMGLKKKVHFETFSNSVWSLCLQLMMTLRLIYSLDQYLLLCLVHKLLMPSACSLRHFYQVSMFCAASFYSHFQGSQSLMIQQLLMTDYYYCYYSAYMAAKHFQSFHKKCQEGHLDLLLRNYENDGRLAS